MTSLRASGEPPKDVRQVRTRRVNAGGGIAEAGGGGRTAIAKKNRIVQE